LATPLPSPKWFDPTRDTAYPDRIRRREPGSSSLQGWTALSDMRPTDGVLHVVPIPSAMAYVLLRALQEDVADDDLCGAANGQALPIREKWHSVLLPALSPIPAVEPGDSVWTGRGTLDDLNPVGRKQLGLEAW
jgi:hypothetical protein